MDTHPTRTTTRTPVRMAALVVGAPAGCDPGSLRVAGPPAARTAHEGEEKV